MVTLVAQQSIERRKEEQLLRTFVVQENCAGGILQSIEGEILWGQVILLQEQAFGAPFAPVQVKTHVGVTWFSIPGPFGLESEYFCRPPQACPKKGQLVHISVVRRDSELKKTVKNCLSWVYDSGSTGGHCKGDMKRGPEPTTGG